MRNIVRNRMAVLGFAVIAVWTVVAIFAPLIASQSPVKQNLEIRLEAPSSAHIFGTDEIGRDEFSRVVHGTRISLPMGVVVVAFALVIGSIIGATTGYFGGVYDL